MPITLTGGSSGITAFIPELPKPVPGPYLPRDNNRYLCPNGDTYWTLNTSSKVVTCYNLSDHTVRHSTAFSDFGYDDASNTYTMFDGLIPSADGSKVYIIAYKYNYNAGYTTAPDGNIIIGSIETDTGVRDNGVEVGVTYQGAEATSNSWRYLDAQIFVDGSDVYFYDGSYWAEIRDFFTLSPQVTLTQGVPQWGIPSKLITATDPNADLGAIFWLYNSPRFSFHNYRMDYDEKPLTRLTLITPEEVIKLEAVRPDIPTGWPAVRGSYVLWGGHTFKLADVISWCQELYTPLTGRALYQT